MYLYDLFIFKDTSLFFYDASVVNTMDLAPLWRGPLLFLVGIVDGGKLPYMVGHVGVPEMMSQMMSILIKLYKGNTCDSKVHKAFELKLGNTCVLILR